MVDYLPRGTKRISVILWQNYLIKSESQLYSHNTHVKVKLYNQQTELL